MNGVDLDTPQTAMATAVLTKYIQKKWQQQRDFVPLTPEASF